MKLKVSLFLMLLLAGFIGTSHADAICKDGSRSNSSGSGTCSWHGGVLNWLPKIESSSSYSQDSYYDHSDNGVSRCKYRRLSQSKKECEKEVMIGHQRALEYLQKLSPPLGKTKEDVFLEKWDKDWAKEMEWLSGCYQKYGVYSCPK